MLTGLKHAVWSVPGSNVSVTGKLENCHADLNKEPHGRVFGHKKITPQRPVSSNWSTTRERRVAMPLGHPVVALLGVVLTTREGARNKVDLVRK